jgi:hypothetical protein
MSDTWFVAIPADPRFVPSPEQAAAAEATLRALVGDAEEIEVDRSDAVVFRDCGANFWACTCPRCGADLTDSVAALLDDDFDGDGFALDPHPMPCCGAEVPPHELIFEMPQGFSRFALSARNPERWPGEDEPGVAALAAALGGGAVLIHRRV